MLVAFLLLAAAPARCGLMIPVAPDEAAARRIATAIVRNVPAMRHVTAAAAAGRPYQLVVQPDRDDPGKWSAFQRPPRSFGSVRGGGGLEFRIDRCTGAVSRMHYSR